MARDERPCGGKSGRNEGFCGVSRVENWSWGLSGAGLSRGDKANSRLRTGGRDWTTEQQTTHLLNAARRKTPLKRWTSPDGVWLRRSYTKFSSPPVLDIISRAKARGRIFLPEFLPVSLSETIISTPCCTESPMSTRRTAAKPLMWRSVKLAATRKCFHPPLLTMSPPASMMFLSASRRRQTLV